MPKQRVKDLTARLFIGLPVPDVARSVIRRSMNSLRDAIDQRTEEADWHITLLFLGEVDNFTQYLSALLQPLPRMFVPTVSLTHLGRGLQRQQLWAYIHKTAALDALRADLEKNVVSAGMKGWKQYQKSQFVPHVRVAALKREIKGNPSLPDVLSANLFTARQAHLYRSPNWSQASADKRDGSSRYETLGTIPLIF